MAWRELNSFVPQNISLMGTSLYIVFTIWMKPYLGDYDIIDAFFGTRSSRLRLTSEKSTVPAHITMCHKIYASTDENTERRRGGDKSKQDRFLLTRWMVERGWQLSLYIPYLWHASVLVFWSGIACLQLHLLAESRPYYETFPKMSYFPISSLKTPPLKVANEASASQQIHVPFHKQVKLQSTASRVRSVNHRKVHGRSPKIRA